MPSSLACKAIDSDATGARNIRRRPSAFIFAAFLIAGFFAALNLSTWYTRITYPGEESYEGIPLAEMARLRQGVPIYNAPSAQGFADATYGPLYYLLGSRLINPEHPSYLPLRLLSAFAMLACAGGCGLLAFWLTRSYAAAFLSLLVFLSYGVVTGHGIKALSDAVALLLFFSGFLVAYRFRNTRAILLAAPLMILGFFYKPQYIAGPVAVLLFLLLEKRYRRAAQFAGLLAGGGMALFAFFQWVVFAGQSFWRHFLLYQSSLLSLRRFENGILLFALVLLGPVVLSTAFLHAHQDKLIGCFLISSSILGLVTYGKVGSGFHYFFECVLALSVLVPALLIKRIRERIPPIELVVLLGAFLLLGQFRTSPVPTKADFSRYNAFETFLRRQFHPHALALAAGPGDLVQAGLETPFSGLFTLSGLAHRGIASGESVVGQIQARKFAVIILTFDLGKESDPTWRNFYLTEEMRRAIVSGYKLTEILDMPTPERQRPQDRFYIYVPLGGSNSAR